MRADLQPHGPIRAARPDDALAMLRIHRSAVQAEGPSHYPARLVAAWAAKLHPDCVAQFADEIRTGPEKFLVMPGLPTPGNSAELAGWASLLPGDHVVQGLYVHPDHMGRGYGAALLAALEALARSMGLGQLSVKASLNAEAFYRRQGYNRAGPTQQRLESGPMILCTALTKSLIPPS